MLEIDPKKRISPQELMKHIKALRAGDSPRAKGIFIRANDNKLSVNMDFDGIHGVTCELDSPRKKDARRFKKRNSQYLLSTPEDIEQSIARLHKGGSGKRGSQRFLSSPADIENVYDRPHKGIGGKRNSQHLLLTPEDIEENSDRLHKCTIGKGSRRNILSLQKF